MNWEKLQQCLLRAARSQTVSDDVPYAFEQRVMARLAGLRPPDLAALWARALWRGAAVCVGISLLLGIWSLSSPADQAAVTLETAVYSTAEHATDTW